MNNNVIKFKKTDDKNKKLNIKIISDLEKFVEDCKNMKCQGFMAFAWVEDDIILVQDSYAIEQYKTYPMIGVIESYKEKLLKVIDGTQNNE